jgi:hypothetical protein
MALSNIKAYLQNEWILLIQLLHRVWPLLGCSLLTNTVAPEGSCFIRFAAGHLCFSMLAWWSSIQLLIAQENEKLRAREQNSPTKRKSESTPGKSPMTPMTPIRLPDSPVTPMTIQSEGTSLDSPRTPQSPRDRRRQKGKSWLSMKRLGLGIATTLSMLLLFLLAGVGGMLDTAVGTAFPQHLALQGHGGKGPNPVLPHELPHANPGAKAEGSAEDRKHVGEALGTISLGNDGIVPATYSLPTRKSWVRWCSVVSSTLVAMAVTAFQLMVWVYGFSASANATKGGAKKGYDESPRKSFTHRENKVYTPISPKCQRSTPSNTTSPSPLRQRQPVSSADKRGLTNPP